MTVPTTPESTPVKQRFGSLVAVRLGWSEQVCHRSVTALDRLLAHSMGIRDLYKKAHWRTSGATFYELHLLFDKPCQEQLVLIRKTSRIHGAGESRRQ